MNDNINVDSTIVGSVNDVVIDYKLRRLVEDHYYYLKNKRGGGERTRKQILKIQREIIRDRKSKDKRYNGEWRKEKMQKRQKMISKAHQNTTKNRR